MAASLAFRTAITADEAALFACYRAALHAAVAAIWGWDEDWQRQDFRDHFAPTGIVVAEYPAEPVGYCQVEWQPARLYVRMLVVRPSHQRRNIGSRLLDQVLQQADTAEMLVALQVFKINPQAQRLYERRGFRVSGETGTSVEMSRPPAGA